MISEPQGTSIPLNIFSNHNTVYAIAGGTGITPVRSLIHSLDKKIQVFYGVKTIDDFIYKNEIENWYIKKTVESNLNTTDSKIKLGYVTSLLTQEILNLLGIYFICGPKNMIDSAIQKLREIGIPEDNIYVSIEKIVDGTVIGPVLPLNAINYQN